MKLITKEILEDFKKMGSQENSSDPTVIVKFFNPSGAGTWYATEVCEIKLKGIKSWCSQLNDIDLDKLDLEQIENIIFFGYISIFGDDCDEFGNFSLKELQEFRGHLGLGIERDTYFKQEKLSKFKK